MHRHRKFSRLWIRLPGFSFFFFLWCGLISSDVAHAAAHGPPNQPSPNPTMLLRPNIVLINLDDADQSLFTPDLLARYLPNLGTLSRRSLQFTNCHVTTPLCGPSRVCLLRGQYAHRTGIKTNRAEGILNNGFSGGYQLFLAKGWSGDHIGAWMQQSGYRTMMIGKYAHGQVIPETIKGWDDMHISYGGAYYNTVRYSNRYPEGERRRTPDPDRYRTDLESEEIEWFLRQHFQRNAANESDQPFFMYVAPLAPHKPSVGSPMLKHELADRADELELIRTPDFNELEIEDKPDHLRIDVLNPAQIDSVQTEHRNRMVTMISVDQLVQRLTSALTEEGELENTVFFLTSDHGYQLGHNRMIAKKLPYHRNTNVPLMVAGPGIKPGSSDALVSHIDLAATFLELAETEDENIRSRFDGKSLVPLIRGDFDANGQSFRTALLIENWEEKAQLGNYIFATYSSLRLPHEIYTEWANGSKEYYDLSRDPYQLENAFNQLDATRKTQLASQLRTLKRGLPQPVATVATTGLVNPRPVIRGFAEDDNGIKAVAVTIVNESTGQYFDGQTWQNHVSVVTAKLQNPGGLISVWEIQPDLTATGDLRSILVSATAVNSAGATSSPAAGTLTIDAVEPVTELRLPEDGSTVEREMMLFGVCSDDQEIHGIRFVLKRLETGEYWDGNQWVLQPGSFIKRLRNLERWHVNMNLPAGQYHVTASAFDSAGNQDSSPSESRFTVK